MKRHTTLDICSVVQSVLSSVRPTTHRQRPNQPNGVWLGGMTGGREGDRIMVDLAT